MGEQLKEIESKDFYAMHTTDKGLALLTKVMAREIPLKFTRVCAGDGFMPEGGDPYKMTALVNHVTDLPICSKHDGGGVAVVSCYQTSKGLSEPYDSREIGLFADDPDEGEILYAYFNAGSRPDFIPSDKSPVVVDWLLSLVTVVGRAATIEATIDNNLAFVTHDELDQRLKGLFPGEGNGVDPSEIDALWAWIKSEQKPSLRPINIEIFKQYILSAGNKGQLKHNDLHNHYSRDKVHVELFRDGEITISNRTNVAVEEAVIGSDCIDVEDTDVLQVGVEYILVDGEGHEFVEVKEILTANRFRTVAPVSRSYGDDARLRLTNWTYHPDGTATAQTGEIYWSLPLTMTLQGENTIVMRRDIGAGTLQMQHWHNGAWVTIFPSSTSLIASSIATPTAKRRCHITYTLPTAYSSPLKLRIDCTAGPVAVDWIVIRSIADIGHKYAEMEGAGSYNWTAPAGVVEVFVTAIAGGSGGDGGGGYSGKAGQACVNKKIAVTPGMTYTITLGAGGTGGKATKQYDTGGVGGNTSFGSLLTLIGGGGVGGYRADDQVSSYWAYNPGSRGGIGDIPGSVGGASGSAGPTGVSGNGADGIRGGGGGGGAWYRVAATGFYTYSAGGRGGDGYMIFEWEQQ